MWGKISFSGETDPGEKFELFGNSGLRIIVFICN